MSETFEQWFKRAASARPGSGATLESAYHARDEEIAILKGELEQERKRLDWILNTQDACVGERHDNEMVFYRAFWRQYNSFNQTYFQHTEWVDSKTRAIDLAIIQTERGN